MLSRMYRLDDVGEIFSLRHYKYTFAVTSFCPEITYLAFFLRVIITPTIIALIFNSQESIIMERRDQVWIKSIS